MKTVISVNKTTRVATLTVTLDAEPPQPLKVDWGDGTVVVIPSGTLTASRTYAKPGGYDVAVQGNDVRATQRVYLPDVLKAWDPEKYTKTPEQMRARERDRAAQVLGQRANVG